jgi:hypothetical protein
VGLGLRINPILMTYFVVVLTPFKHALGQLPQDRKENFIVAKAEVADSVTLLSQINLLSCISTYL